MRYPALTFVLLLPVHVWAFLEDGVSVAASANDNEEFILSVICKIRVSQNSAAVSERGSSFV